MKYLIVIACLMGCQTDRPLPTGKISNLSYCSVSLRTAKRNLLAQGYGIEHESRDNFTTDFKKSDFEDVKSLLSREVIVEHHRRFTVFAVGKQRVMFRFKYRIVDHGSPGLETMQNPDFVYEKVSRYERIKKEVCGKSREPQLTRRRKAKRR